jgi:hypothetical protein
MVEIVKQGMADIWASAGDVVPPAVEKIAEGWLVEVPPRQFWNWMQNRTDSNLAHLFQRGIPSWDTSVEYIAGKSFVAVGDVVYKSTLTGTNQNPLTAPTYWAKAFVTWTAAAEALAGVTGAADKMPYFTSASAATTTTVSSFMRTVLDDTTATAARTTLSAQGLDATLTAIANTTTAVNKLIYFTGVNVTATTDLTDFGRSLIDDGDATAARLTLILNNVDNTSDVNKPVSSATATALSGKEPTIATGTIAQFVSGTKTLRDLATDVRAATLTGLSTATSTAVVAGDNVLGAIGKLQGQANLAAPQASPTFTGTGTFNGSLIANVNGGFFEVGRADGVAGGGYIDFHSGATVIDHDARIAVTGGTGVNAQANMSITAGTLSYANAPTSGSHLVNKTYSDNASNLSSGTVPDARLTGTYTGVSITGNAATATTLATARTINNVSFNGSANITIEDDTKLPLTGGRVTGTVLVDLGTHGGYGNGNGGTAAWGNAIWSIGTLYDGVGQADLFVPTNMYGMAWIRGSHGSHDAQVGEGVYFYQAGAFRGGVGTIGIKTSGTFYGSGAGITALNAGNLTAGTIPDARIAGSYTGMVNLTGSGTVDFAKFAGLGTDTAALPSYTWTGDTNTGMFSPAADQIAFSTGGVQRLLINNLGLTAVGTELTALDGTNITIGTIAAARVATLNQSTTGSAATLTTARTIALAGEVTGTATSFNGGANISIATTVTDSGWLTLTLVNSFTQHATSPLRYRKVGNVVFVQGAVQRTTTPPAGTQITTLPVGFRPSISLLKPAVWFDSSFNSQIHTPILGTDGALQNGFTYALSPTVPSGAGSIQVDFSYTV